MIDHARVSIAAARLQIRLKMVVESSLLLSSFCFFGGFPPLFGVNGMDFFPALILPINRLHSERGDRHPKEELEV